MRPGSHAADDGSFARSTGIQVGRAALLIAAAVAIGLLLLHHTGGGGPVSIGTGRTNTTSSITPTSTFTSPTGGTPTTGGRTPTTPPTTGLRQPQDIKVLVANGTTTAGLAARISNLIHSKGYITLASVNSTQKPTGTVISFQPSYSGDAAALAAKLGLPASAVQAMSQPPAVSNLNGANILVIVGPDLANAGSTTSST